MQIFKQHLTKLAKLATRKLLGATTFCTTKGRICAHCEAEIADQTAFVIGEQLIKRANDLSKNLGDPQVSKELKDQARSIMSGSWFEEFDSIRNI